MASIGEIAHSTGAPRRMLRTREPRGLIEPASIDESGAFLRWGWAVI